MWYCNNCKSEFSSPIRKETTFEDYYGVSHLFPDSHSIEILICPECKEDGYLEEMRECDYCGEWTKEDDLEDTDGCINGGIGYLCPQCIKDCEIREV